MSKSTCQHKVRYIDPERNVFCRDCGQRLYQIPEVITSESIDWNLMNALVGNQPDEQAK